MSAPGGPRLTLDGGTSMPALGLGVGAIESEPGQAAASVEAGLRVGSRLIDTAAVYGNEAEVAEGIAASGVPRSEVFVTTKLWITDYGYESALRAFDAVAPAVNQVELHPYFAQPDLRRYDAAAGTVTQAWSPVGGVSSWGPDGGTRPGPLADTVVLDIAAQLDRTPAQVLLRWHLQRGDAAITTSLDAERVRKNVDVFGFHLTAEHVTAIDALDTGVRGGRTPRRSPADGHLRVVKGARCRRHRAPSRA